MNIAKIQKQLEQEHKALDLKYKFISDLQALMQKYNQSGADLLAILTESESAPAAAATRRSGKAASAGRARSAAASAAPKARKKQAKRPLRKFRNPNTGEVAESRAPQVDKTIRGWADDLKVDWRTLEV